MKTKLILIFKIISAASFIYIGALIFLLMKNDVFKVNDTIITFSIIDFLLTIFMFSFLILGYRYKILKVFDYLTFYGLKLKKNLIILLIAFLYPVYLLYRNFTLVLINGFNREALILLPSNVIEYILSSFFFILVPCSIVYNYEKKTRLLIIGGALFFMAYQLSRSPIFFIGLCTLLLFSFKGIIINKFKLLLSICLLSILLGVTTIYQGRAESILEGFLNVSDALFRYRSYSFYLAQFVFEASDGIDKILFPFFGWFSERSLTIFLDLEQPISTSGSDFVYKFRYIGRYRPNVLYPWWAFFYAKFGFIGLFLKMVYSFIIFRILVAIKLPLTLLYFLYILLFYQFVRHPFINASGAYTFISIIFLDIILKYNYAKNSNN